MHVQPDQKQTPAHRAVSITIVLDRVAQKLAQIYQILIDFRN